MVNEAISSGLKGAKSIPKGFKVQSGASARLSEPLWQCKHCLDAVVGEKALALASSTNRRVAHTCTAPLCQAALSSKYHAPARVETRKSSPGHEKLASCLSHSFLFSILFDTKITLKFPFKQHLDASYARAFAHIPGPGFRRWNMLSFHSTTLS